MTYKATIHYQPNKQPLKEIVIVALLHLKYAYPLSDIDFYTGLEKLKERVAKSQPSLLRTKRYDVKECALCVVYQVNQTFKDRNLIDAIKSG